MVDIVGVARELVAAVPSPVVRQALLAAKDNEIFLRYDWIVNWDRFNELTGQGLIDFHDGSEGLVILLPNNHRKGELK